LVFHHDTVGELVLGARAPGETFSAADRQLLSVLARQAAIAVHAVHLAADLERSRVRVVAAREEGRQRLGSDLHDGLSHRMAGLLRIAETA
jgi:signal transduction histidine kinase